MIEELSFFDASVGFMLSIGNLAMCPIELFGIEEQKQKYLQPMKNGDLIGAFALTEPTAGSDATNLKIRAVPDGGDYIIEGEKTLISSGDVADVVILFCQIIEEGKEKQLSALIVETKGLQGFTRELLKHKMGLRGSTTAKMKFTGCRIQKSNLLEEMGQGFKIAMKSLDVTRIAIAAQAVGAMQHPDFCGHGDVVWAVRQTAGRGRLSRLWVSPEDTCLTLTIVLTLFKPSNRIIRVLGLIAALAVRDTLEKYSIRGSLKWPNDVLVNGKKIAGILTEANFNKNIFVMGIGLNVNMDRTDINNVDLHFPATSMLIEKDHHFNIHEIGRHLISNIGTKIDDTAQHGISHVFDEWAQYDWLTGSSIEIQGTEKNTRGKYLGLDEQGRIRIVCENDFEIAFWTGDVERIVMM